MQQRRGTAAEWTAENPILATGEFGFETNTGKFKVGNGSSNWAALEYFANSSTIVSSLVDSAPAALNTLNELAAAIADDASFSTTVLNAVAAKAPTASPTFTGTVDFSAATVSGITLPINWTGEYSTSATYAENDMVEYQGSVYYATGLNVNGLLPPAGDWDLFASKGDTGAASTVPGPTGPAGPTGATGLRYRAVETISSSIELTSALHAGEILLVSSSSSISLTLSSVVSNFLPGEHLEIIREGTGEVSIVAGSGVSIQSTGNRFRLGERYSSASIICVATNSYRIVGDLKL